MKYIFPPYSLLNPIKERENHEDYLSEMAKKLIITLKNFGAECTICQMTSGPSVSRFDLLLAPGVSIRKFYDIEEDLEHNLGVSNVRVDFPIPGELSIGIEIPNKKREYVSFRKIIESPEFNSVDSQTIFAIGNDTAGKVVTSDFSNMSNLLLAGGTAGGKTNCIDSIITSLLFKADSDHVKFLLIDDKVVELSVFNGIPHLIAPVITNPIQAIEALDWATGEMTSRLKAFKNIGVRDITEYNESISDDFSKVGENAKQKLPRILIVVNGYSSLMMVAPKEVEKFVYKFARHASETGIHLIISTQKYSEDVLTDLIRVNMLDNRIAFWVDSCTASRTILGVDGAEKLNGMGDMLYSSHQSQKPIRVQVPYISSNEIKRVCDFIKKNNNNKIDCHNTFGSLL